MEYRLKKKLVDQAIFNNETQPDKQKPSTSSSFSSKQILNRSVKKAERSHPQSPRKKLEFISSLTRKFKLRIAVVKKAGRTNKELSQEEVAWEFSGKSRYIIYDTR